LRDSVVDRVGEWISGREGGRSMLDGDPASTTMDW